MDPYTPDPSVQALAIEGAPGYFLVKDRVFSARARRFLARHRYGHRWRSVVRLQDGRPKYVYLDNPNQAAALQESQSLLLKQHALPIEGFPDYVMLPDHRIFRVNPAQRGTSAAGVYEVQATPRPNGGLYVQLTNHSGRRSTFSVRKLARGVFPQNSVDDATEKP